MLVGLIWRLNTKKTLSPHSLCLAKSAIRPREITSLVWRHVIPSSKEMRSPSRTFSQMGASDWSLKRISGETAAVAMLSDPFLNRSRCESNVVDRLVGLIICMEQRGVKGWAMCYAVCGTATRRLQARNAEEEL